MEALEIYRKIYSVLKDKRLELREGDKFIILREKPQEMFDNELYNDVFLWDALRNYKGLHDRIPELSSKNYKELKGPDELIWGTIKIPVLTIKIGNDILYDIEFKIYPCRKEINNGNEICIEINKINKDIYKFI